MKAVAISSLIVAVVLVCGAVAPAQSLGEVARREAERRKAIKAPGKVYTNESLRTEPAPSSVPPPSATQTASSEPAQEDSEPDAALPAGEDPRQEAYWQERLTVERDALARAETFAEALQSRINALSTDFVNRDDPAQRNVVAADREKAMAELDRVRQEIVQHQKAIDGIQEDARRAGVPAGWVR